MSLLVEILLCYVLERVRNGNRVPEKNAWLYVAFLLELLLNGQPIIMLRHETSLVRTDFVLSVTGNAADERHS